MTPGAKPRNFTMSRRNNMPPEEHRYICEQCGDKAVSIHHVNCKRCSGRGYLWPLTQPCARCNGTCWEAGKLEARCSNCFHTQEWK